MSLLTGHGEWEDHDYDNWEDHGLGDRIDKKRNESMTKQAQDLIPEDSAGSPPKLFIQKLIIEKPYCKRCKHKEFNRGSVGVLLCHVGRHLNPMGDWLYPKCRDKNKDFQCEDFVPRWPWKSLYKKQEMTK